MRISLFLTVILLVSCSTMKNSIQKNQKKAETVFSKLLEENGNAFYLTSSYATFSTVWSYRDHQIVVYKLGSGEVSSKQEFVIKDQMSSFSKTTLFELDSCMELDGDIFGFKIKEEDNLIQEDLPISIECFKKGKYQSDFLNKIVRDITNCKMWDIKIE